MPIESLQGMRLEFSWPISPMAVAEYARLTGDEHPIHIDERSAQEAGLTGTIVQGSLLVAIMANAAGRFFRSVRRSGLSYGYDKLRFTNPVATHDTLLVRYQIAEHDIQSGRMQADVSLNRSDGALAAVAVHLTTVFPEPAIAAESRQESL